MTICITMVTMCIGLFSQFYNVLYLNSGGRPTGNRTGNRTDEATQFQFHECNPIRKWPSPVFLPLHFLCGAIKLLKTALSHLWTFEWWWWTFQPTFLAVSLFNAVFQTSGKKSLWHPASINKQGVVRQFFASKYGQHLNWNGGTPSSHPF